MALLRWPILFFLKKKKEQSYNVYLFLVRLNDGKRQRKKKRSDKMRLEKQLRHTLREKFMIAKN